MKLSDLQYASALSKARNDYIGLFATLTQQPAGDGSRGAVDRLDVTMFNEGENLLRTVQKIDAGHHRQMIDRVRVELARFCLDKIHVLGLRLETLGVEVDMHSVASLAAELEDEADGTD